jgi:hypothetical protein
MSYFFLIFVITSNTSNMQVTPMQRMEQCQAAITAMKIAKEKRTWRDASSEINNAQCIEVK